MKKILSLLLAVILVMGCLVGCNGEKDNQKGKDEGQGKGQEQEQEMVVEVDPAVAMITDYSDITDQSFNQTTYEACKAFCDENEVKFKYFKPAADSTADRVFAVETAIDEGYNIIVLPGYTFAGTVAEVSKDFPEVKFIALDLSTEDLLKAGVTAAGKEYDNNPDNWKIEDYVYMDNVYCAVYKEEISGYMAGYAAVKLGYKELGFLGGMVVPSVMRYGYGFVQGVDAAAKELNVEVNVKYAYATQFHPDADITAAMDTWYANGTEVVFACGGGIYSSVAEAASKEGVNGKMIGVDTDQSVVIDDKYGEGITVTSAMKGLYLATYDTLVDAIANKNWDKYAGNITTLGLVSDSDPTLNYVQIPMETTQWEDGKFTQDDYKALVKALFDGTINVSNDISKEPTVEKIKVEWIGNIK